MITWRHYSIVIVFGCCVVALCGRVGYLAVTQKDFLQEQGDARSVRAVSIPAMRGMVVDRHGEALAVSTPVFGVWTDPTRAKFEPAQLTALAQSLEIDPESLEQKLQHNVGREFLYLRRQVDWDTAEAIRQLQLPYVYTELEYRRYYPAAETAAHVVGVTDIDDGGIEGVEKSSNAALKGSHGRKVVLKDRLGNTVKELEYQAVPVFGDDVQLSIDLRLQFAAYRELKSAVASHKAKSASLVILDVKSGEILALVNQPSYNPNDVLKSAAAMRNRAITDTYEPGSTIKPFTVLAALESGEFHANSSIDTSPGFFKVGNKLIQDPSNRGVLDMAEILQTSSQVGVAKIALALQEEAVFDVLRRAGLGDPVNIALPGEVAGYVSAEQLRYPIVRTSLSFGYGLSVTPLQLARAYLALASGGNTKELTLVKQPGLRVAADADSGQRVFNADQVRQVIAMMEGVTGPDGTAPGAAIPGYRVAGKTGTARKVGPQGYDDERHVAWFAGLAPVSDPRVVVVVLVNEPKAGLSGGGAVAAPVFSRVASRALRLLGARPDQQVAQSRDGQMPGYHG